MAVMEPLPASQGVNVAEEESARDEVIVIASSSQTGGALFRLEYVARAVTAPPENHSHPAQAEHVEVLTGHVSCRIEDREVCLGPGESLTFPAGVPHAVWSADPAGSRSIGEFRPALATEQLFGHWSGPRSSRRAGRAWSVRGRLKSMSDKNDYVN
jgi:quercetin dioxygenase-like cupin family protein